jgi:hypothetical protein
MLPVGMRNASITKARKTKANMKAVISHSKMFATSAALSFLFGVSHPGDPETLTELTFSVVRGDIATNYSQKAKSK